MTVFFTAIHLQPANDNRHEAIAKVRWFDTGNNTTNDMTKASAVAWLQRDPANRAFVQDGRGSVEVGVVNANPPYLRTFRDNRPTDNLLSLPRF